MQVSFKYNNGNVVRMERVYADILQRINKGVVVEQTVVVKTATQHTSPNEQRTSDDGDTSVQPPQTQTSPKPVANNHRNGNNGNNRRRRRN